MIRRIALPVVVMLVASAIGCAHGVDPTDPDAVSAGGNGAGAGSGAISGSGNAPNGSGATVSGGGGTSSSSGGGSSTGAAPSSGGGTTSVGGGSSGSPSAGGTGVGGSAGTAGATGAGGVVVDPILPGDVVVRYMPGDTSDMGTIAPQLNIVNRGKKVIPLAQLTIRYWYTADAPISSPSQQVVEKYDDQTNRLSGNTTTAAAKVGIVMPPQPMADTYIEVGFTGPASIGPGQKDAYGAPFLESGAPKIAVHWSNYMKYDQTNDYSYAAKTAPVDWPKVTLYQNGVLVWGTEPDGTMPSGMSVGDGGTPPPPPSDAGHD